MGDRSLRAFAVGLSSGRRLVRRPLWAAPHFPDGRRSVRRRFDVVRLRRLDQSTDCGSGHAGIWSALLVPGSLAIISSAFSREERGRAIGTWSGFSAITAAIGPVLGGWLIDHVSWRAVFFINIPLALIVIAIAFRHVPESRGNRRDRLDLGGAFLTTVSLGALVFALIESSRLTFANPAVLACFLISGLCFGAFVFVESRRTDPMLPLGLFRSRTFTGANLLTLFLYGALSGTLFFFPMNLIQVQHYSPTEAGAAFCR
jgi:Sugar phosphate permease